MSLSFSSQVPLDPHDLLKPPHGPGGVLTVPVPDQSSTLDLGLQLGEDFVRVLLPDISLPAVTTDNTGDNNGHDRDYSLQI